MLTLVSGASKTKEDVLLITQLTKYEQLSF